jgi:hypothetical protein
METPDEVAKPSERAGHPSNEDVVATSFESPNPAPILGRRWRTRLHLARQTLAALRAARRLVVQASAVSFVRGNTTVVCRWWW